MTSSQQRKGHGRGLRNACSVSFGLSLLLSLPLAWRSSQAAPLFLVASASLVVLAYVLVPYLQRRGWPYKWVLSLALLNLMLGVPEIVLRLADFHYESGIQFGYPRPTMFRRLCADPEVFWKYNASDPGVNAWGFYAEDVMIPKRRGATRVLFLGDSCTEQGYPATVEALMNAECGTSCYECVNLALSGYSSHQGLKTAQIYGPRVDPDIVFVYFGWNDHWAAYGARDSDKKIVPPPPWMAKLNKELVTSRLVQFAQYLVFERICGGQEPLPTPRVTEAEYAKNLEAICNLFNSNGIPVVLITAPTSHPVLGVPQYLVENDHVRSNDDCIRLHRVYNDVVRRVQKSYPMTLLCELEKKYAALSTEQLSDLFMADGIHFTEAGRAVVAEDICKVLRTMNLTSRESARTQDSAARPSDNRDRPSN